MTEKNKQEEKEEVQNQYLDLSKIHIGDTITIYLKSSCH